MCEYGELLVGGTDDEEHLRNLEGVLMAPSVVYSVLWAGFFREGTSIN